MSRIGRMPVAIPQDVKVAIEDRRLTVRGPKGELNLVFPREVSVDVSEQVLEVKPLRKDRKARALHGLSRALIANMVHGVVKGFSKNLEITGVGYRAQLQGKQLTLNVGFSHPVVLDIPEGLAVKTPKPTIVAIEGCDRQLVGQFAADVRSVARPEPYKGKGIKYAGESIRRKAGKAATGSGAKAG